MAQQGTRRLTVMVPAELAKKIAAAELSHRGVDQFVVDVLSHELARWDAAFPPPAPPEDLRRALDANPAAAATFATMPAPDYHTLLDHLDSAKRPGTRARRLDRAIARLADGHTRPGRRNPAG